MQDIQSHDTHSVHIRHCYRRMYIFPQTEFPGRVLGKGSACAFVGTLVPWSQSIISLTFMYLGCVSSHDITARFPSLNCCKARTTILLLKKMLRLFHHRYQQQFLALWPPTSSRQPQHDFSPSLVGPSPAKQDSSSKQDPPICLRLYC